MQGGDRPAKLYNRPDAAARSGDEAYWVHQLNRLIDYLRSAGLGPHLVRSVASGGALYVSGMFITFFIGVMLARGLETSGYGVYGIAMAVAALAGVVAELGMTKLIVREVAVAVASDPPVAVQPLLRWADRNCILLSLLVAVIITAAAYIVVEPASAVRQALLWSCPFVAFAALASLRGGALRGLHFVTLGQAPVLLLRPLLFAIFLFAYFRAVSEPSAGEAMAIHALAALLVLAVTHIWLRSRIPVGGAPPPRNVERSWLRETLPMALAAGLINLHGHIGVLLLGIMSSESETGLFRVAVSIYVIVSAPNSLLTVILSPLYARLHAQGDWPMVRRISVASAWTALIGSSLISLPLFLGGKPIMAWLFGPEYVPALPAILIVCAGVTFSAALGQGSALLSMTGHERRVNEALVWAVAGNVLMIALLVPRWGASGAAIAMVSSLILWNFLTLLTSRRLLGVDTSVAGRARSND